MNGEWRLGYNIQMAEDDIHFQPKKWKNNLFYVFSAIIQCFVLPTPYQYCTGEWNDPGECCWLLGDIKSARNFWA